MESSLLATKLHLPFLPPRLVQRPHLIKRLNEGLAAGRSLTLVSAPAGFGKTTCIREWVNGLDLPVSWLSLDPADDDPGRFFSYLLAALRRVDEAIGREQEGVLRSGQLPPLEALIIPLINDILTMGRKFILVLDDVQMIRESAILKALERLIANQPRNLHLVLVTREDPQLPLARLRANQQMTEIRAGELRFSGSEVEQFMNRMAGLSLSEADVDVLENRTEGWVVGVQLAALALQATATQTPQSPDSTTDQANPSSFIAGLSGSHRYILSYLTEEVLSRQPEEVQLFLLQTSILERLSGSLCNAVLVDRLEVLQVEKLSSTFKPFGLEPLRAKPSNLQTCQQILKYLEQSNLFLIPLDDEGRWYRYHHLFADLLQAQLRQAYPADAIAALHRRAAAWYEQNEFAVEAVDHALAARDFDGAARLVERYAYPVMTRGELTTLLRWIEALPEDVIRKHPLILIQKAWTLTLAGAVRQVEPLLQQAESQIEPGADTPAARELLGNAAAIRAFFAMMAGEYPGALERAERAEKLLPESSVQARWLLPYTQGAAYRGQGQYEKAAEAFTRQARMGEAAGNLIVWVTGMTEVVNTRRVQGRLLHARETGRQALRRMAEQGAQRFGSLAKLEVALVEVLREQNEIDEAQARVTDAIDRMQAWPMPTDRVFAYLALARIQESQGDFTSASDSLRIAMDLKASYPVLISLSRAVDLLEIRLCLAAGDVAAAVRLMENLRPGESRMVYLREQELGMLARVRLAQGRPDEAVQILDPLVHDPGTAGRLSIWLEILALQACALDAQGDREAALAVLLEALASAGPEGFVRVFVDEGEAMLSLLEAAARQLEKAADPASMTMKAYIDKLLSVFPGSLAAEIPSGPAKNATGLVEPSALIEPLTARELEVLRLIAEGLKYEEIAERLFISLNTVRTYVRGIYSKLNVNNRSKAIAAAHQHRLIE